MLCGLTVLVKMRFFEFVYIKTNGIWRQTWDLILNILSSKRSIINIFSSLSQTVHCMELILFNVSDIDAVYLMYILHQIEFHKKIKICLLIIYALYNF